MPIIITTNESEQQFTNKEEVKFNAVQSPKTENVEEVEEPTEESATEENTGTEEDKTFDYLNSNKEDDESNEHDDEKEDEETDDEEQEVEKQPKKNGFKKRIDKLTKRNSEYEARIAELESRLNGNNKQQHQVQVEAQVVEELKEPNINDFEEYTDYVKALAKYEINQENKALKLKSEEELIKKEAEQITAKYRERVEDAKKRYGVDKWNGLQKIDLPLSIQMRAEIMQSEVGPDILFYLYHNLEENKKINSLTPAGQIKELTKLELKISNKLAEKAHKKGDEVKEKISKAPAPVKPISSKTDGKTFKDPNKMSYQEYKVWMAERESRKK